jgi:hypothetical protein
MGEGVTVMSPKTERVDGQNIVYHYFQKVLLKEEHQFSLELIKYLIVDLSIWIPPCLYRRLPILLPFVIRDPSCRKNRLTGKDEWGEPNQEGFLRDDNSLIKGIVRSFKVSSSRVKSYDGKKLGNGFVASHIWREIEFEGKSMISSRHYMLNSFIPNLVWLPVQISKFTDREGSVAQRLLQAISHLIYQNVDMPKEISDLWRNLPFPQEFRNTEIDLRKINYFVVPDNWTSKRVAGLLSEIDLILSTDITHVSEAKKVKSRHYLPMLRQVRADKRGVLNEWLMKYRQIIQLDQSL